MLNIKPTHDLVYIKKRKLPEKSNGGILLTPSLAKKENIGHVMAVGPGKTYSNGEIIPLAVKEGDEVIYSQYAGQTFKIGEDELIALREDDIYAVVNG
jgi:chaperonin GroES